MNTTLAALIERQGLPKMHEAGVIPWSCPVLSFGDPSTATVATVGLNPSNREFVDSDGNELAGPARRFHTLQSLGLKRWTDAQERHVYLVNDACQRYFSQNPYDIWFRQLDYVFGETGASYYGGPTTACHLDLVPYATACKWTALTPTQRSALFDAAGDTLGQLVSGSRIEVLILNGKSVVAQFQSSARISLASEAMPAWALRRQNRSAVVGVAYWGKIDRLFGVRFRREVLVLGFNHNLQSSFGVTREVRFAIRRWIGAMTASRECA